MALPNRIHVIGASCSGTSTLGREIAARYGHVFLDSDDFFWQQTDPPYQTPMKPELRIASLTEAVNQSRRWVLSGSICKWGDSIKPLFDLVVFVITDPDIRMARLRDREARRFGARILPGGDMHETHKAFAIWAAGYETGDLTSRSRQAHEQWLHGLQCPIHRVDGSQPVDQLCREISQQGPA